MSQQTKNREIAVDFYRSFDQGRWDHCRELVSPTLKAYVGGKTLSAEEWEGFGRMFMDAFPDGAHQIDFADAAGDYVFLCITFTGTHRAPFMGMPATGNKVRFTATMVDKVEGGKLVEHRGDLDSATLMQQISPEAGNRALVEKMLASVDAQDWPAALELVSPACKAKVGSFDGGREAWMGMGQAFQKGFPDGRHTIQDVVTAGDRVIVLGTWAGTHRGDFHGLPATGKCVSFSFIQTYRVAGGKIVEHHGELDSAGMMQQLAG
jgi:predicted ester cyclase